MQPLVSVLIPAYNCAGFVAEAVQSALGQSYEAKEIIVVNDGSTDGTLAVLRGFGDAIRIVDQKNGGPPLARNAGLRIARGEYIAFLDADDVWARGKLAAQVFHLEARPEVGAVFTGWQVWRPAPGGGFARPEHFDDAIARAEVDTQYSGWIYNRLLFECEMLTTTVMLRASVVRAVGEFDVTLFNGDDYDYWLRASRIAQINKLRFVGALYRVLPSSVSRRPHAMNSEYEVVRRAVSRWGLVGPNGTVTDAQAIARRLEELTVSHAYAHLQHGDPHIAFAAYRDVLSRHPARMTLWIRAMRALIRCRRQTRQKN